jgi:hypothetical protein
MAILTDLMTVATTQGSRVSKGGSNKPRGVFITAESLTFPAAGGIALAVLTALNPLVKGASTSVAAQAMVCGVLGVLIYFWSLTKDLTVPDRIVGAVVALLNTILVFGSVAGLITLATNTVPK